MINNDAEWVPEKLRAAVLLYQSGSVKQSADICGVILEAHPNNGDALHLLGLISHQIGNNEMALDMISRAIMASPDNPDYYYNCGIVCHALGFSEESAHCYRRVIELKPGHLDALMSLGNLNLNHGDFSSAVQCYQSVLSLDGNHVSALQNMVAALLGSSSNALEDSPPLSDSINIEKSRSVLPREQPAPPVSHYSKKKITARQIPAAISSAIALQNSDQLEDAEEIYRQVLRSHPANSDALHLLGLIAHQRGDHQTAVDLITRAVKISPSIAFIHNNLGLAWHDLGKINKAVDCYRRAIDLDPSYVEPYLNLGTAHQDQKNLTEAVACFLHALELSPDYAKAHNNLGRSLCDQGDFESGLEHLKRAVALDPGYTSALSNIGATLCKQHKYSEARFYLESVLCLDPGNANAHNNLGIICKKTIESIEHFKRAIALKPDFTEAYSNLGAELCEQEDYQGALLILRQGQKLAPDYAPIYCNLAVALNQLDQPEESIECSQKEISLEGESPRIYLNIGRSCWLLSRFDEAISYNKKALSLNPDYSDALNNLATVFLETGRAMEGIRFYEKALEISPDNYLMHFNLGNALLEVGSLERGWIGYDYRWKSAKKNHQRPFTHPWWDGTDLTGKTILVWCEQGIGDEILFANAFSDVVAVSKHCIIECESRLISLFSHSFPKAEVIGRTDPPNARMLQPDIDWQIPAGNLFRWFRPTIASFPRVSFLQANQERVRFWKQRIATAGNGLKVGIAWRSKNRSIERDRCYSELIQWGPILTTPGITFVNLQYDDCHAEIEEARKNFGVVIHEWADIDLMNDLDDAAALTSACDLVISAAIASCMISGSVGVPTWRLTLLQDIVLLGVRDSSPFFPEMRPFRKTLEMSWDDVIETVSTELRGMTLLNQ